MELRLKLGGHRDGSFAVDQGGIYDAARGDRDRNLKAHRPPGVQSIDERLDHRGLKSINQARPSPGKYFNERSAPSATPIAIKASRLGVSTPET